MGEHHQGGSSAMPLGVKKKLLKSQQKSKEKAKNLNKEKKTKIRIQSKKRTEKINAFSSRWYINDVASLMLLTWSWNMYMEFWKRRIKSLKSTTNCWAHETLKKLGITKSNLELQNQTWNNNDKENFGFDNNFRIDNNSLWK